MRTVALGVAAVAIWAFAIFAWLFLFHHVAWR